MHTFEDHSILGNPRAPLTHFEEHLMCPHINLNWRVCLSELMCGELHMIKHARQRCEKPRWIDPGSLDYIASDMGGEKFSITGTCSAQDLLI